MSILSFAKLPFVKYQGAGNDFILIDDRALAFNTALVSSLCRRKFGIGADGLILLQNGQGADFRMRIFNSDGSEAESCGNGLRCLMQFLLHLGFPKKSYRIATADRIVEADYFGEKVSVQMGEARNVKQLYIAGREVYFLDTGVPHAVVFVPDLSRVDVMNEGAALRHHTAFQPCGANANFASLHNGIIHLRTFERGLERESLACGTGAAAAGFLAAQQYRLPNPIQIQCLGGLLEIEVTGKNVRMIGPAEKVFVGRVLLTERQVSH